MHLLVLKGQRILSIDLGECNERITFHTDSQSFHFICDASCCSESWINHISGIECLLGEIVLEVQEIELEEIQEGEKGHSGKQECDQVLMYKIITEKGTCDIEFRNSSNGYYGGSLSFIGPESTSLEVRKSGIIKDNF